MDFDVVIERDGITTGPVIAPNKLTLREILHLYFSETVYYGRRSCRCATAACPLRMQSPRRMSVRRRGPVRPASPECRFRAGPSAPRSRAATTPPVFANKRRSERERDIETERKREGDGERVSSERARVDSTSNSRSAERARFLPARDSSLVGTLIIITSWITCVSVECARFSLRRERRRSRARRRGIRTNGRVLKSILRCESIENCRRAKPEF